MPFCNVFAMVLQCLYERILKVLRVLECANLDPGGMGYMGMCRLSVWFVGLAALNKVYSFTCLFPKHGQAMVLRAITRSSIKIKL